MLGTAAGSVSLCLGRPGAWGKGIASVTLRGKGGPSKASKMIRPSLQGSNVKHASFEFQERLYQIEVVGFLCQTRQCYIDGGSFTPGAILYPQFEQPRRISE